MIKTFRLIPALGAVLFALTALSACGGGGGVPSDSVVSVDGTGIRNAAFKHWIGVAAISGASGQFAKKPVAPEPPAYTACINHLKEIAPKPAKGQQPQTEAQLKVQCESQYKSLSQEVLGFLISSQWVLGEAKSLGIDVSDDEVRKQFVKIRTQQFPSAAEFEKFLSTSGQTVSDLLLRVKLNMLSQKIQKKISKQKSVTQAEIQKYYNENKSRYSTAAKRKIELVLTKNEAAAKAAKQEIESGKSIASVAAKRSIDTASKSNGGQLEVSKGQEEASLDNAIFSAQKNALSGPVKTAFGYYVFKVASETAASQQSLSQVQQSIKQQLTATQQQGSLSKFVKDFKTKWKAKTDCRAGYVVPDCKQSKEPKTSSTGTTATTTK